jgi:hypothetical protein
VDTVALFHYATKSREDFAAKVARGSAMSAAVKRWEWFDQLAECAPLLCCAVLRCQIRALVHLH